MNNTEIDKLLKDNGLTETELIFKNNVKRLRLTAPNSPTMVEVATGTGIKYGTYRLIESLTPVNVKFETMEKIAQYHNIPVKKLFELPD